MDATATPSTWHRAPAGRSGGLAWIYKATLWAFLLACVFDPADRLLGAKVWAFAACWGAGLAWLAASRRKIEVPLWLLGYVAVFILIPLSSVALYYFRGGGDPFEGVAMLKGYVLITFALLLALTRTDLFDELSAVLSLLSCCVIAVFAALLLLPEIYLALHPFSVATGILVIDARDYGEQVVLLQVYFVTSPMIAIAIAHYYGRAVSAADSKARSRLAFLVALNVAGMLLAGSRNNILVSILLPLTLWFVHSHSKALAAALGLLFLAAGALVFRGELAAFFDPSEPSNEIKIQLLSDYARLFSDIPTLLLGQGLGAYNLWTPKGEAWVTELTYLEMIRNFGLAGAAVMMTLLMVPIVRAIPRNRPPRDRTLALGYGYYLVMCAFNPNLFSSMGILILSLLLAMPQTLPPAGRQP